VQEPVVQIRGHIPADSPDTILYVALNRLGLNSCFPGSDSHNEPEEQYHTWDFLEKVP